MNKRRGMDATGHMIGGLFTFALFGLFVILSLLIVVIGVDGYRGVVNTSESVGEIRTSLGYVAGKLRSEAASSGVRLSREGELDVLVLTEIYDGEPYDTYIYHMDGSLNELTICATDTTFDPEMGWRLSEVSDFEASMPQPNLVNLKVTALDGRTQSMHVALRAAQEVSNR